MGNRICPLCRDDYSTCSCIAHIPKEPSLTKGLKGTSVTITEEHTGGSSSYYSVSVQHPTTDTVSPYMAECNDIIEALGMNYAEGNAFKAIWRTAAARNGKKKKGNTAVYDAEKVIFFGERMLAQAKAGEA
jgi:hypothetical protein